MTSDNIAINSTNFSVDKNGNMRCVNGYFDGTINTSKDATVGNNLYVGQNQTSGGLDTKFIKFTDGTYISKSRFSSGDLLQVLSNFFTRVGCINAHQGTEIDFTKDSCSIDIVEPIEGGESSSSVFNSAGNYTRISTSVDLYGGGYNYIELTRNAITASSSISVISDKNLKKDIKTIDNNLLEIIDEVQEKQFRYKDGNGLINVGIIAQDLINAFKKCNKNPFEYDIVKSVVYNKEKNETCFVVNYEQYLVLKNKSLENKIKNLEEQFEQLKQEIKLLKEEK